jgi:DNA polymerase-3 subunit beta
MKIEVNLKALVAMLNLAAKEDVRYYLNGVMVETSEPGFVRYLATNGHQMGLYREKSQSTESLNATEIILPAEKLKMIKLPKYITHGILTVEDAVIEHNVEKPRKCSLQYEDITLQFEEIQGRFPDYKRVLPIEFNGEAAQFDPELINAFAKLGKVFVDKKTKVIPIIMHNGTDVSGVMIDGIPEFYGAIMSYKFNEIKVPLWLIKDISENQIEVTQKRLVEFESNGKEEILENGDIYNEHKEKLLKYQSILKQTNAKLNIA